MGEWARQQTAATGTGMWMTLDASSSDRFGFWRQVFLSLADADIVLAASARELVAVEQPIPDLQQRLVRAFAGAEQPVTLVIDDFHHAAEGVEDDLAILIERAPQLRVVLGTRTVSSLENARNRARIEPFVIDADALQFTEDETVSLARQVFPDRPTLGDSIHQAVGGWAIATRLVLIELERAPEITAEDALKRVVAAQASSDSSAVFLRDEPDSPVLRFAARSSLAEWVSTSLADDLGGDIDVPATISWFEKEGLAAVQTDGAALGFRWQPVVRAAMRAEMQRRYPGEVIQTHKTIAQHHLAHGEPMRAIVHAVAADDWKLANSITRQYFSDLMLYHQPELLALLETAPRRHLRSNLGLVATLAILHFASPGSPVERRKALADFGASLAMAMLRQESRTERLWVYSSLLAVQRVSGKYDAALATADRIAALAARFDASERAEVRGILPLLMTQVATTTLYADQSQKALEQLQLVPKLTAPGDDWSDIHAESLMAMAYAIDGNTEALRPVHEIIERRNTPQGWYGSYPAAGFHIATAIRAIETYDTKTALDQVAELRSHAETLEHWPLLLEIEGLSLLITGTTDLGDDFSRRLRERHKRTPASAAMRARLASLEADILTASGRPEHARTELERYPKASVPIALALSRTYLVEDVPDRALETLRNVQWPDGRNYRHRAEFSLVRAAALLRVGAEQQAELAFSNASKILESQALTRPWMMIPRADADMLSKTFAATTGYDWSREAAAAPDVFSPTQQFETLTKRETLVLAQLTETDKITAIAERLYVSPNTVKTQIRSIYRKLGVNSRANALAVARQRGLL